MPKRSVLDVTRFSGFPQLKDLLDLAKDVYEGVRLRVIILLLFYTGGRINEVLTLKREQFERHVDHILIAGMTVFKQKNPVTRDVPIMLSDPWTEEIWEHVQRCPGGFIVPSYGKRKHLTGRRVRQQLTEIASGWWPHRFRAERAFHLGDEYELDTGELMDFFKWDNIKTAKRYARVGARGFVRRFRRKRD